MIATKTLRKGVKTKKQEIEQARTKAIERLRKLSPDALKYVLKPIEWAYNWTDQNEPESMNDEDSTRFSLVNCALHDSSDHVRRVYEWHLTLFRLEMRDRRRKQ